MFLDVIYEFKYFLWLFISSILCKYLIFQRIYKCKRNTLEQLQLFHGHIILVSTAKRSRRFLWRSLSLYKYWCKMFREIYWFHEKMNKRQNNMRNYWILFIHLIIFRFSIIIIIQYFYIISFDFLIDIHKYIWHW